MTRSSILRLSMASLLCVILLVAVFEIGMLAGTLRSYQSRAAREIAMLRRVVQNAGLKDTVTIDSASSGQSFLIGTVTQNEFAELRMFICDEFTKDALRPLTVEQSEESAEHVNRAN